MDLQHKIRENAADLDNYIRDLKNWENEMKKKDKEIREAKSSTDLGSNSEANAMHSDDQLKEAESSMSERKKRALGMKESGNEHFKKENYAKAIEFYTAGMQEDPENAIFPANRAMAYMKIGEMFLAEQDCSKALVLDSSYVKAYLRRGSARVELNMLREAEEDFIRALELEPKNKQALAELGKIWKNANIKALSKNSFKPEPSDSDVIHPIKKDRNMRSKKPLVNTKVKNVNSVEDILKEEEAILLSLCQKKTETTGSDDIKGFTENGKKSNQVGSLINTTIPAMTASETPISEKEIKKEITTLKSSLLMDLQDVSLPSVPTKSYQFQADWKKLKNIPQLQYEYLKQFPPEQFASMFQYSMDSELFADILGILAEYFMKNGDAICPHLLFLSKIGRFQTLLLMMSEKENAYVKKLLDFINSSGDGSCEDKNTVSKMYN